MLLPAPDIRSARRIFAMPQNVRRIALFCFALSAAVAQVEAQTFSVLHNFSAGADGANPRSGITVGPGGVLYGTAEFGGPHGNGTVFKLSQMNSSWVFSTLYGFARGSDRADPIGGGADRRKWRLFITNR